MNYWHGKTARLRALRLPQLWFTLLCSLLLMGGAQIVRAATVTFTTNTTIDTNTLTYEGYDVIVHGCTVTINGAHSFQSLTIESNGIVTHAQGLVGGMNLTIAGNVTVNVGSSISANARGYGAGQGPGHGSADSTGSYGGGGGAYGGEARSTSGASGGIVYGSIKAPTDLGSGGGYGYAGSHSGYSGGGAITLAVGGSLQVNGILSANGDGGSYGGGGSGGTVNLNVGTLSGAGAILATGGYVNGNGGGGGGGRIAVVYAVNTYTGALNASGAGSDYGTAGAGTVFQQGPGQTQGDLLVDNNNSLGLGTPIVGAQTFDNVRVRKAGQLTPLYQQTLQLTVLNVCTVESGGFISANGRGFGPNQGPGHGTSDNTGSYGGAGGAYGGEARNTNGASGGSVYGSIKAPTDFGSGGGNGYAGSHSGYSGGGALNLVVNGTLNIDGTISANGDGGSYGGGGSGGTIVLNVGTLSGGGAILANGGFVNGNGGGGSGGRIAIFYNTDTFTATATLSAAGAGSDYGTAGAGTIFRQQTNQTQGDLWIQNNGYAGLPTDITAALTFDNVVVWNQGILSSPPMTTLRITTLGNFTILAGGYVSVNARGYHSAKGPGAGGNDNTGNYGGAGGSYGGKGHNTNGAASGSTYGSSTLPTDFGSGGGFGYNGSRVGYKGGGALYLTVNGTLQVDGTLSANGDGGSYGGGGSGGSLLLRAGMLTGGGAITANGGYVNGNGGGGGGGRIAEYYVLNNFTGTLSAAGANSDYGVAQDGTITQQVTSGNLTVALSLSSTTVGSGQITYLSVDLSGAAPAGGIDVQLSSSNPLAVAVPPTVTIPEGQTSAVVPLTANLVTQTQTTTLQAQLWDQVSTQTLTVKPFLGTLVFNPSSANGNSTVTGTLTLNTPAPAGGFGVILTSSNPNVSVPAQIAFAGGTTTRTFSVSVGTIATAGTATISAVYGPEKLSSTLFVNPSGITLLALSVAPASVIGGNSSAGVVVLSKAAPTGGVTVALASGDATIGVPASVMVPAGKTSASFAISTQVVASPKSAIISATLGVTKMATLNVRMPGVGSLILIPSSVSGGDTSIGIVTLEAASGVPVVVTITSSKTQAVPDSVFGIR